MRPPSSWSLLLPFLVLSLAPYGLASKGDRSHTFKTCVSECQAVQCHAISNLPLPLSLKLAFWTCSDVCKYDCMHAITSMDLASRSPVKQYYGKWPFWRLGGIQEPASVAFSLLNLLSHVAGMKRLRSEMPEGHPMKRYYYAWAFASINTWVWSSIFHTRGSYIPLS